MSGCVYTFAHLLRFQWMPLPAVLAHPDALTRLFVSFLLNFVHKLSCMNLLLCMRAAPPLWPIQCQIRADVSNLTLSARGGPWHCPWNLSCCLALPALSVRSILVSDGTATFTAADAYKIGEVMMSLGVLLPSDT